MAKVVLENGELILRSDWCAEDMLSVDDSLTDGEVKRVMELIARTHDANIGINWEVIQSAIDIIKGETK